MNQREMFFFSQKVIDFVKEECSKRSKFTKESDFLEMMFLDFKTMYYLAEKKNVDKIIDDTIDNIKHWLNIRRTNDVIGLDELLKHTVQYLYFTRLGGKDLDNIIKIVRCIDCGGNAFITVDREYEVFERIMDGEIPKIRITNNRGWSNYWYDESLFKDI